jgi:hypothetical protein
MWILSILLFINISIFAYNFSFIWYMFYILIWLILNPLYRVSEHVFDLKLMDTIKVKWSDFFPAMILREIPLWVWRIFIIIFFIFLVKIWIETENILKIWLVSIGIFLILASHLLKTFHKNILLYPYFIKINRLQADWVF